MHVRPYISKFFRSFRTTFTLMSTKKAGISARKNASVRKLSRKLVTSLSHLPVKTSFSSSHRPRTPTDRLMPCRGKGWRLSSISSIDDSVDQPLSSLCIIIIIRSIESKYRRRSLTLNGRAIDIGIRSNQEQQHYYEHQEVGRSRTTKDVQCGCPSSAKTDIRNISNGTDNSNRQLEQPCRY